MLKKGVFTAMFGLLSLGVMACGTPKDTVMEGYEEVHNAETYEATSDVSVDVSITDPTPEEAQIIEVVNNASLSIDQRVDQSQGMMELGLKASVVMPPMNMEIELPFLIDNANEKAYIEGSHLSENFGMFFPFPEEIEGRTLELNTQPTEGTYNESPVDVSFAELEEEIKTEAITILEDKADEDFTEIEDGTIEVTFSKEELDEIVTVVFTTIAENSEDVTKEEVNKDIEEFKENSQINEATLTSTFENGHIVEEEIALSMAVDNEETTGDVTIHIHTTYHSIGEEVEFTINPEEADLMDENELTEIMTEAMMGQMGGSGMHGTPVMP